jgi:hypothetical protein
MNMGINGIGGMTSADMVAYLALQASQEDKKAHDAMRRTEETIESQEDQKEISSMEDKAVWTLVGGLGSAAMQGANSGIDGYGQAQGWKGCATGGSVDKGFGAAEDAWKGTSNAMVGFADKDATQHKVFADRAQRAGEDCNAASKHAQQSVDQALDAARTIRQSENETLLLSAKRG